MPPYLRALLGRLLAIDCRGFAASTSRRFIHDAVVAGAAGPVRRIASPPRAAVLG